MAGDKREVRVAVVGDAAQLQRELLKAEGQLSGFGNNAKKSGDILRNALFGGAVLYGAKKLVDAAGELQQSVGGTAAVFEEASGAVNEFTKNSADLVGMSENASRTITSRLGASLKGFGMSTDEAAAQAINLTKTGADLAATLGGKTDDAVNALGSALRGEYDPLERFGIALKASEVNAKAVSMGLADSETDVTAYAKGQATLALITERSAFAQGQFAREADTAQGQAQRAQAKTEDAAASLGQSLLPVYTKIQETIGFVADAFSALPGPAQTAVIGFAGVIAIGPSIVEGFKLAYKAVQNAISIILDASAKAVSTQSAIASMNSTTAASSAAAGTAAMSMGPLIAVMIAAAGVYKVFSDNQAEAARESAKNDARVESFTEAISDNTKTLEDNIRSVIAQDIATQQSFKDLPTANFQKLAEAITGSSEELDELVRVADKSNDGGRTLQATLGELAAGGNSLAGELKRASFELLETGQASGYSSESLERLVRDLDGMRDSLGKATAEQEFATEVVDNLGAGFGAQASEAEKATKALEDLYGATNDLFGANISLEESQINSRKALQEYNKSLSDGSLTADERTQEGLDLLKAYQNETQAAVDAAQAAKDLEGKTLSTAEAAGIQAGKYFELAETLAPDSPLRKRLTDLGVQFYLMSLAKPVVAVDADTSEAQRKLNSVRDTIRDILGLTSPGSPGQGLGFMLPRRATGGPVDAGSPYMVGEKGPELFVPSGYGRIIDAFSTSKALLSNAGGSMGGGGGNVTINVNVSPTADKAAIGQTIVEAISSYERRSGPGWRN
jgi:hypothetical protein